MSNIYPPRRYHKAMQLTAHVMHIIHNIAPANTDFKALSREIENLFYSAGVDVITEADRIQAGLQPRDHNGLTIDEIRVLDARYLKTMLEPFQTIFPMEKE